MTTADTAPATLFIDVDGVILKHHDKGQIGQSTIDEEFLPGVIEKFHEWEAAGHRIILCTGRRESFRGVIIDQLEGLPYDDLIMGCTRGKRIVINDTPDQAHSRVDSYNLKRNEGLESVNI